MKACTVSLYVWNGRGEARGGEGGEGREGEGVRKAHIPVTGSNPNTNRKRATTPCSQIEVVTE